MYYTKYQDSGGETFVVREKFAEIRAWISRSEERELIPDTGAMKPLTISDPITLRGSRERHKRNRARKHPAERPRSKIFNW
jgi:hypothetical protein